MVLFCSQRERAWFWAATSRPYLLCSAVSAGTALLPLLSPVISLGLPLLPLRSLYPSLNSTMPPIQAPSVLVDTRITTSSHSHV